METEHLIEQALGEVMSGRTTFVIAHRLSSVKRADEVLVIDSGQIVERGRHEDLILKDGPYRRIYDVQMRDQEEFITANVRTTDQVEVGGRAPFASEKTLDGASAVLPGQEVSR